MFDPSQLTKHIVLRFDEKNWDSYGDDHWVATLGDPGNTPLADLRGSATHPLVALHGLLRLLHDCYDAGLEELEDAS